LQAFLISKFEMTQGQWVRATYSNPSQFKTDGSAGSEKPVESISWEDSGRVLRRLHLDLPTEAQWEYAAKAGSGGDWFVGDNEQAAAVSCISQSQQADAPKEPRQSPCDVTYGQPNRFGLFGIIGNVWEWCLDPLCPYNVPTKPGTGERQCARIQRVFRGGSFYSEPNNARMSLRRSNPPEFKSSNVGVRPALRIN
jgi:formylglycine-generating enzyme required for sulfatase activity